MTDRSRNPHPAVSLPGSFTPNMTGTGTSPPPVTSTESNFFGASVTVAITGIGVLGIAVFTITVNGTPTLGLTTAASVNVPGLPGAQLHFSAGTYLGDNVYTGML